MAKEILRVENLCKSFGPTQANRNIDLLIERGKVHGLAGENGSGKSTLASVICGIQKKDCGKIFKDGEEYHPLDPIDANASRIAMVVQELGVVGSLPGMVNMYLGRTKQFQRAGLVSLKRMKAAAEKQFTQWGLPLVPLECPADELSIEQRKVLELARALSNDPDFLVLDEISQALSHDNREMLCRFITNFVSGGRSILMITHDLEEMLAVCDDISVLRDGEVIATRPASEFTENELKRMMIGREVSGDYYRDDWEEQYEETVMLRVENLCVPGGLRNIHFELHRGEILGVCGLSDGGIHQLGSAIFGLEEGRTGTVTAKDGRHLKTPGDIIAAKGAYLSKDRDADGLMLDAGVGENIQIPSLVDLKAAFGYLNPDRIRNLVETAASSFEIKATGMDQVVKRLSGGNKQKVNLSRWMIKNLDFVVLDCPTRGVDVGVKAYIYSVLRKAKQDGLAILLVSDELPEAMGMADRILVMKDFQCAGMLSRKTDFTEEKIVEVML